MNRSDCFMKQIIKIRNRRGTNCPLVNRDPYNYIFHAKQQKSLMSNKVFSIEEMLRNTKVVNEVINNEEIKKIIYQCKKAHHPNRSVSCSNIVKLPHLELKSKQNYTDGIENRNLYISKTNRTSSVGKTTRTISVKRVMKKSQSQKDLITKSELKRLNRLNSGIKIKGFYCTSRAGETIITSNLLAASKRTNNTSNTINKDAYLAKMNINSKTLGPISLFGVFNGTGEQGHYISKAVKHFLLDYFENSTEMQTSRNKDNYYTILSNAFIATQNYLKNTLSKKYDCYGSGTTSLLLLAPENNTHIVYCANSGNSKCVLYSVTTSIPLSYEHYPSVSSERERLIKYSSMNNEFYVTLGRKISEDNFFYLSRVLGNFIWEDTGITPEPEIIECDLNKEEAKFIIIGTDGLWKYLTQEQAGEIVTRYYEEGNSFRACKELEEAARLKWRKFGKEIDDITVIVIFLQWENFKL